MPEHIEDVPTATQKPCDDVDELVVRANQIPRVLHDAMESPEPLCEASITQPHLHHDPPIFPTVILWGVVFTKPCIIARFVGGLEGEVL